MELPVPDETLLQKLNVGIIVHAPDTRITFCNRRASELLGLPADRIQNHAASEPGWALFKEDGARMSTDEMPVSRAISTGQAVRQMVVGIMQPGSASAIWMMVDALPEFDAGGMLLHVVVSFYEISTFKHDQQALKEKAKQLEFVLEGSELGFWDWNIATGSVIRNARWAAMLGYTPAEMENTTRQWTDFIHPADREKAWDSINAVLEGRSQTHKQEYRMLHKHDGIRWILDQASVMEWDEHGKPVRMCGTHTDITERKMLEEALKLQAQTDYLTGSLNRRRFMEMTEHELKRANRYGHPVSLLMLDIDWFKQINDSHGHKIGDIVLKSLAEICRYTLRDIDIFGRLGGEEFAILLPESDQAAASEVAERLRENIAQTQVPISGEHSVRFTVSIGIATLPLQGESLDSLLQRADEALYQAKHTGRNRVCA